MKKTLLLTTLLAMVSGANAMTADQFSIANASMPTVARAVTMTTNLTDVGGTTGLTGIAQTRVAVGAITNAGTQPTALVNRLLGLETAAGGARDAATRIATLTVATAPVAGAAGTSSAAFLGAASGTMVTGSTFIAIPASVWTAVLGAVPTAGTAITNITAEQWLAACNHTLSNLVVAS